MSKSMLRVAVIVLTLITAGIHLYLGVASIGDPSIRTLTILWLLDGAGYLILLGGVLGITPVLKDNKALAHYALMGIAAATILAWYALGDRTSMFGIAIKVEELLLIIATFMHLRKA